MSPAPRYASVPWVELLAAMLRGVPSLPGALCRDLSRLFDERDLDGPRSGWEDTDDAADRHAAAVALCRRCPAAADCAAWADTQPRSRRPAGVIAGQLPSRVGRPRKVTP